MSTGQKDGPDVDVRVLLVGETGKRIVPSNEGRNHPHPAASLRHTHLLGQRTARKKQEGYVKEEEKREERNSRSDSAKHKKECEDKPAHQVESQSSVKFAGVGSISAGNSECIGQNGTK